MIIVVSGKQLAFGLTWRPLVGGGSIEAMAVKRAREAKAPLIWSDRETLRVGLVPEGDISEKDAAALGAPIYAAAKALARVPNLKPHVVLVFRSPSDKGFVLTAVYKGQPRDKFDLVDIDGATLEAKLAEYRKLLNGEEFDLLGEAPGLEGIRPMSPAMLAASADESCALHRPKTQLPVKKLAAAAAIFMGLAVGWKFAHPYIQAKIDAHNHKDEKTPEQKYQEAIERLRTNPVLSANQVGPWYAWFRSLPYDVGGWHMDSVTCNFAPNGVMACSVDYKRALVQATYKTFLSAIKPELRPGAGLDHDTIHLPMASEAGPAMQLGKAFDTAPHAKDTEIEFGSHLQSLGVAGKFNLAASNVFGADGIDASALANPYRSAAWTMDAPVRDLELFARFPWYALVSSIKVNVGTGAQPTIDNSMFKATVTGQVLVRG